MRVDYRRVLFTELEQWLQMKKNRKISVVILQQTHWDFSWGWSTDDWNFFHSAAGRKGGGGVLEGVRRDLADPQHIRWQRLSRVDCSRLDAS